MGSMQSTTAVTLVNNPPRPANGDGDIIMQVGSREFSVKWKNGIPDVSSDTAPAIMMRTDEKKLGAVQCYKCWVDTESGAWICLPTAC